MSMQDGWIAALERLTRGKAAQFPATRQVLQTTHVKPVETRNRWILSRRQVAVVQGLGLEPRDCTARQYGETLVIRHSGAKRPVLVERCHG